MDPSAKVGTWQSKPSGLELQWVSELPTDELVSSINAGAFPIPGLDKKVAHPFYLNLHLKAAELNGLVMITTDHKLSLPHKLTERQVNILRLFSQGASAKEICSRLNMGDRCLRSELQKLRSYFDANSTTQLIAKASAFGILE